MLFQPLTPTIGASAPDDHGRPAADDSNSRGFVLEHTVYKMTWQFITY